METYLINNYKSCVQCVNVYNNGIHSYKEDFTMIVKLEIFDITPLRPYSYSQRNIINDLSYEEVDQFAITVRNLKKNH